MNRPTAPRGTFDVLPAQSPRWQALERLVDETCERFGYGQIRTPIFESTDVFVRTIGEDTDIVDKEMYTFADRGGRSITLRPEFTAPVARAVLEHNMLTSEPLKLYYRGPIFRYERPQKGRYRQSHQWGAECFAVAGPAADAEIIALGLAVIRAAGITDTRLEVNSIGCAQCRGRYREALVAYLTRVEDKLNETSRRRLQRNPLRILDTKDPDERPLLEGAPAMSDFLCEACRAHFDGVQQLLAQMGISSAVNPRIVRGLDYYTRTVFEISSSALGSQDALCGGGRYDGLIEAMGGPPTPGIGLAMGMERLLFAAHGDDESAPADRRLQVALVALDESAVMTLAPLLNRLRARGIAADMDYSRRKIDKQIRWAGERGAKLAIVVGGEERAAGEATLQDLTTRARERVKFERVEEVVAQRLGSQGAL